VTPQNAGIFTSRELTDSPERQPTEERHFYRPTAIDQERRGRRRRLNQLGALQERQRIPKLMRIDGSVGEEIEVFGFTASGAKGERRAAVQHECRR
jgi:hypothetical protein